MGRRAAVTRAKHALGLALMVAAGWACAGAAGGEAPWAGPARCRFAVPEGMPRTQVRWTGGCRAGLAQGLGMLRASEGGRVVQVFYGQIAAGQLVLGAIELDGGYKAGRFESGRLVTAEDRNALIQAFDAAAAAARQAATTYRKAGNPASARYYGNKAQQLAQQLD